MISIIKRSKQIILKNARLVFAIGLGVALVPFEDTEPLFSFMLFLYFILLFFWGLQEIKSLLKLKREKDKTELLHLQSQVNPHFFFNTLNNLYGLIEKDSKKAKDLVLKLSDMMRYSIYEGQKDWVPLEKEIEYLNNYIELHKARYHKKTEVLFNHQVLNKSNQVRPLLFIILLENAFKHGVENLRENAYIHINLISNENEISFAVENNFGRNELKENNGIGIGLKNLKRRLELVYPNKHSFHFSAMNEVYKAQLILKII